MKENLEIDIPKEKYRPVKDLKGLPVLPDDIKDNIRASVKFDIPVLERSPQKHDGSFIFIAGGPSLNDYIDEIRERKNNGELIATSNMTHDYLIDNGIIPDICAMVDPKKRCADYVKKPHKETKYLIAVVCNPRVFENLLNEGMNVEKVLVGYGLENEEDVIIQMELYSPKKAMSFLTGGTMMGLRAMNLAELLGYKKIEYYGMDSSFKSNSPDIIMENEPRYNEILKANEGKKSVLLTHTYKDENGNKYVYDESEDGGFFYAYKKSTPGDIQIAQASDGRRFITSPVFAHQVKQFLKWTDRLEGKIEVITHGDSLNSHMYKLHEESKSRAFKKIGTKRWTEKHIEDQKLLNIKDSQPDIEIITRPVLALYAKLNRNINILDYGCGKGNNLFRLDCIFNCINFDNYDPFIEKYSHEPEQSDFTICSNMLNFVEPQCIDNVLKHIADKTKYMIVITIRMDDDPTCDRSNYKTDRTFQWWQGKLENYFTIVEGIMNDKVIYLVCQKLDASLVMEKELNGTTV